MTEHCELPLLEGRSTVVDHAGTPGSGGQWYFHRTSALSCALPGELGKMERDESTRNVHKVEARLTQLMELAEIGMLRPPEESAQMRSFPEIAELRIQIDVYRPQPSLYRLYYAEPQEVDQLLLALRFAKKHPDQRNQQQQRDLRTAHQRLCDGAERLWGMRAKARTLGHDDCPTQNLLQVIGEEGL